MTSLPLCSASLKTNSTRMMPNSSASSRCVQPPFYYNCSGFSVPAQLSLRKHLPRGHVQTGCSCSGILSRPHSLFDFFISLISFKREFSQWICTGNSGAFDVQSLALKIVLLSQFKVRGLWLVHAGTDPLTITAMYFGSQTPSLLATLTVLKLLFLSNCTFFPCLPTLPSALNYPYKSI